MRVTSELTVSASPPATLVSPRAPVLAHTNDPTIDRVRGHVGHSRRNIAVGWLTSVALTLLAFAIRFPGLANPKELVFDETYYPKDAWTLLHLGYEGSWPDPDKANKQIAQGMVDIWNHDPSFIVHPQLGKWLIAASESVFGMNSFGWRFSSLIFGCLLVFITVRLVRRITRSNLIAGLTGLLLCLDGLNFVMSRIGLLDIFQAFFVVAAVSCLAADRDWFRERLARHLERTGQPDLGRRFGPALWWRPWRLGAGILFGMACGTKWNALYILAAFALLSLTWDIGARRLAGAGQRAWWGLLRDGIPAFITLVIVSAGVYLATWSTWLATSRGYDRQWGAQNPGAWTTKLLGRPLASLLHYHKEIYNFHTGDYIMHATHSYNANPAGWLFMIRPIGIAATNDIQPRTDGCPVGTETCLRVISGAGTPVLWWAAAVAFAVAIVWWVGARDWRFGVPVIGALSAWLPWFPVSDRPEFFFYAIVMIPFTAIGLAMCIGLVIGPASGGRRRMFGCIAAGALVALVGANFAFMYPILTNAVLTRSQWLARMWLRSWI